jgi:glycosyltransferase involved in cell wall biosynthesis
MTASSLAAVLAHALAQPDLRRQIARAAREHVVAHFSHARFAEQHLALYQSVYSRRLAPTARGVGAIALQDTP